DGGSGGNTFDVLDDSIGAANYLTAGGGDDVVNVSFLPGNSPLTIDGQGGNDAVNALISVNNGYPSLLGQLSVSNRGGATALTIDTTAETSAQLVTLNNRQVVVETTLNPGTTDSFINYTLPSG